MNSPPTPPSTSDAQLSDASSQAAGIARAASLIAAGNIFSRILGLVREIVIAQLFGASGLVSAFRVAQIIPVMLYDLLIGGMVSSAFVPIFSEYAERDRASLWQLASLLLSLTVILLSLVVLIIELLAPQVAFLMAGGFDAQLLAETTRLIRITTPAVLFLGISGIITGLLYALKRFTLPAFTASIFNATIIVVALVGVNVFGWSVGALAVGLLLGATLQVVLQLPGLRGIRLRFVITFQHPALFRLVKLGLPIILGLIISQIAIALDRNLASRTGEQSIAWMQYATTIIQFPLGLIAAAISLAILPTLSRLAIKTDTPTNRTAFMATLTSGIRFVLILIVPATVALFVLAEPIVTLLFQRGEFGLTDTQQTALALRFYLPGLAFAAIDQPLIFAFYARQNTLTPALVGLLGVGFYLAAALLPALFRPLQMTDLVFANSIQLTAHALIMLWLVHRIAPLAGHQLGSTTLKTIASSLLMGVILWATLLLASNWSPENTLVSRVLLVGLLTALGTITYFLAIAILKVPELALVIGLVKRFLRR